MPFIFESFPIVSFDVKKNLNYEVMTNIMVRFKINQIITSRRAEYFLYSIEENEKPWEVAHKIYNDATLDWLIFLTNNIYDPQYDWPLSYNDFNVFIKSKYGSIPAAKSQVHEYRQILNDQSVLYDGTIIPKRHLVVDSTTYATLGVNSREIVYKYDYEEELNDAKRNIKLIDQRYIGSIINAIESVLEIDE